MCESESWEVFVALDQRSMPPQWQKLCGRRGAFGREAFALVSRRIKKFRWLPRKKLVSGRVFRVPAEVSCLLL